MRKLLNIILLAISMLASQASADGPLLNAKTPIGADVTRTMQADGPAVRFPDGARAGVVQIESGKVAPDEGRIDFWIEPDWAGKDGKTHMLLRLNYERGVITLLKHSTYSNLIMEVRPPDSSIWQGIGKEVNTWQAGQRHLISMQWYRTPTGRGVVSLDIDHERAAENSLLMPQGALRNVTLGSTDSAQSTNALIGGVRFIARTNLVKAEKTFIGPEDLPANATFSVIIPQPRQMERHQGHYNFAAHAVICPAGEQEKVVAEFLRDALMARYQIRAAVAPVGAAQANAISLRLVTGYPSEGYRLVVSDHGVTIEASDSDGLFWAVQTLRQWCAAEDRPEAIAAVTITDAPASPLRAHYIEAAWSYLDPTEFKKAIDVFSLLKINLVAINHGERFAYESAPKVKPSGKDARQNTAAQMRDLVAYAKARHVELIPAIRAYSHAEWLTGAYPEISEKGPRKSGLQNYNPMHPQTYPLILGAIDDLLKAYDSPRYIHIGEDEHVLANIGTSPETRDIPMGQLIGEDIKRICDHLSSKNTRAMIWHDMVVPPELWNVEFNGRSTQDAEQALARVPKNAVICYWHYGVDKLNHQSIKYLVEHGYDVLPSSWCDPANIAQLGSHIGPQVKGLMGTSWSCQWPEPDALSWRSIVLAADQAWFPREMNKIEYVPGEVGGWYMRINQSAATIASPKPAATLEGSRTDLFGYRTMDPGTAIGRLPIDCVLRGIPFRLSGVVRGAPAAKDQAAQAVVQIPINAACARLYFLATAGEPKGLHMMGRQIAQLRMIYEDGGEPQVLPVRYGYELGSCLDRDGVPNALTGWRGHTGSGNLCQLYILPWCNPTPARRVKHVEVVCDGTVADLAILGVSGEEL